MKHTMLLALLVPACDHPAPTAPTVPAPAVAPPAATPTPRTFVMFRLTGFVRDDQDTPIAGARVTLDGSSPAPPVVTDATGFYETSASIDTLFVVPTANLTIGKDGYEDVDNVAIFRNPQATADYRMFKNRMVPAGTNARFSIAFNGPLCGLELEYPCRHLVVMAPTRGTLVIETVSDMPSQRFPFGPVSYPPVSYPFQGVTRLSKLVRAGEAVPVEILWVWSGTGWTPSGSESFTLKTSLEP